MFTQPVSMKVTEKQFEEDLEQPLINLGYRMVATTKNKNNMEKNEFAKGFAEWIRDEEYYNNGTVWFKHSNIEMPQYTIDQLLEQYIHSLLNNKYTMTQEQKAEEYDILVKEIKRLQEKYDENGYDSSPIIMLSRIENHIDFIIEYYRTQTQEP